MKSSHSLDTVVALLLFCVFTVSMLLVLISGAGAYKDISCSMEEQYRERTCINYIAAKLRHSNTGGVSITELDGSSALSMAEEIGGEEYVTYIYCYNGHLCELFTPADVELPASEGLEIISADSIEFSQGANGLLHIECTCSGRSAELYISTPGKAGG